MTKEEAATITNDTPGVATRTREELIAGATVSESRGFSKNPVARMSVDLFHAVVVAWENIRDQKYDTSKNHIGIVVDPDTYLMLGLTGLALRQKAKPGDKPNEETLNAVDGIVSDISYAMENNRTGPSRMEWGGMKIFVDPRASYIGVAVFTKPESEPAQVFNLETFSKLQQGFAQLLAQDEKYAQTEKMDELATVSGLVGNA